MSVEIETMGELERAMDPFDGLRCGVCGGNIHDAAHALYRAERDALIIDCLSTSPPHAWRKWLEGVL